MVYGPKEEDQDRTYTRGVNAVVNAAEFLQRRLHHGLDTGFVRHISLHRYGAEAVSMGGEGAALLDDGIGRVQIGQNEAFDAGMR